MEVNIMYSAVAVTALWTISAMFYLVVVVT